MKKILNNFKKAFSLTETIIMLTILAIAVASMTPMVTRKIVNNTEAGATINGVAHGRYEIYSKEIVTYGTTSYEKTTKPTGGGVGFFGGGSSVEASILVFERLDDLTYASYAGSAPKMNNKGQKSTLYEQIENAKPHRTPNGNIDYVEFKKQGVTKKYPVGGNIIVEGSDVIYTEGRIIAGNPDTFEKKSGGVVLPNNTHRIIEGVLTKKYHKTSTGDNNTLWHIDAKNDNTDNFEGTVTVIPWEKVISGNNTIIDKPIKKDVVTGEYVGTFDPGVGTKSLVIHAVGGGGAGGGLKDVGSAITPKTANDEEIKYMKQTLAKRFKEVAAAKGLPQANIHPDVLVKVVNNSNIHNADYKTQFGDESDTYILLNRADGSITVKFDTRNGLIFPHELLDYTNILGSQTQESDLYNMPIWGDFNTLATGGKDGPFYAGAVGCGCAGGKGTSYAIDSTSVHFEKKWGFYCPAKKEEEEPEFDTIYSAVLCPVIPTNNPSLNNSSSRKVETALRRKCRCQCGSGTYYPNIPICNKHVSNYSCNGDHNTPPVCVDEHCQIPTDTECLHKLQSGVPGAAPACAVACTKVEAPILQVETSCDTQGCPGEGQRQNVRVVFDGEVSVKAGGNGRTCSMVAGEKSAVSSGGTGSQPCYKYKAVINGPEGKTTGGAANSVDLSKSGDLSVEVASKLIGDEFAKSLTSDFQNIVGPDPNVEKFATAYANAYQSVLTSGLAAFTNPLYETFSDASAKFYSYIMNTYGTIRALNIVEAVGKRTEVISNVLVKTSTISVPDVATKKLIVSEAKQAKTAINKHMNDLGYNANVEFSEDGLTGEIYGPDAGEAAAYMGKNGINVGPLIQLFEYSADETMASVALECNSTTKCGKDGSSGRSHSSCENKKGIDVSMSGHGKRFNHIYSWTMPYAMNRLAYGEAGEAGEYKTTKIAKTTGEIEVHLGLGGVWEDFKDADGSWTHGKRGKDGTDTIVKMSGMNVLVARGGKGGAQSLYTHRYDLCYAKKGECKRVNGQVICCENEIGKRSTKEILTTAGKMSAFENIKALAGNSLIIGIGLGRGGEGAGSRANVEQLKGLRVFRNSSGYNLGTADKILGPEGSNALDIVEKFKNFALAPSALNFKGGDGAVIITW